MTRVTLPYDSPDNPITLFMFTPGIERRVYMAQKTFIIFST